MFIKHIIDNFSESLRKEFLKTVKIGVICTAYSNGSFMDFIKTSTDIPLVVSKTGMKYLYEKSKLFAISILFESNGHGGIIFSQDLKKNLQKLNCFASSAKDAQFLELLNVFLSMFNSVRLYLISNIVLLSSIISNPNLTITI